MLGYGKQSLMVPIRDGYELELAAESRFILSKSAKKAPIMSPSCHAVERVEMSLNYQLKGDWILNSYSV
jgi:hypothetical protein